MNSPHIKTPEIKGWCPGALRPMMSGDGLLVRIRPPLGQLTPAQAAGVARAAVAHGNGIIDLSSRANLQLRGVKEPAHPALIEDLQALGLLDPDVDTETARNLVITPFRDDATIGLAANLNNALAQAPTLPGKFGFAVDTGPQPVMGATSADIRLERAASGGLILRADGMNSGMLVTESAAVRAAIALAEWFLACGGMTQGRGRMAALIASGRKPDGHGDKALPSAAIPLPGLRIEGALVGMAFGQMDADTLMAIARCDHIIRLTPWRMILLVGATRLPDHPSLVTRPDDPILRVTACTGATGCPQALGPTRDLARMLAPLVAGHLHVSGCTKGCAHPGPADSTLVASARGYNLVRGGSAQDVPHLRDLPAHQISDVLYAP